MTRPLTDDEVDRLGGDDNYAIIPAHPAGTTVRRRPDRRIVIRNQYTFSRKSDIIKGVDKVKKVHEKSFRCLLYTSPSPRDQRGSRMPSSA